MVSPSITWATTPLVGPQSTPVPQPVPRAPTAATRRSASWRVSPTDIDHTGRPAIPGAVGRACGRRAEVRGHVVSGHGQLIRAHLARDARAAAAPGDPVELGPTDQQPERAIAVGEAGREGEVHPGQASVGGRIIVAREDEV